MARSGELMIRQDESTRRSTAVLFVDTRDTTVGQTHTPCFEKVISGAASLGMFGLLVALPLTATLVILGREFLLPTLAELADKDPSR